MTTKPPVELVARCQEILDWHKTGLLKDGVLRAFARKLKVPEQYQLALAESQTGADAMRFVVAAAKG